MDYLLLIISFFILGYFFGHRDLRHERLFLESLSSIGNLKEKVLKLVKGRSPTLILESKDFLKEDEEEDINND